MLTNQGIELLSSWSGKTGRHYCQLAMGPTGESDQDSGPRTRIQEFYRNTNVFITGATGFLGKLLIEKLLRSCPDIDGIYVLVRAKKGKKAEDRVGDITSSKCFSRVMTECPSSVSKIHAIVGDAGEKGLGITQQNCQLLAEKVNIVFHMAATVNFTQDLDTAIKINVRGTRDLLIMSKSFKNLKSFVHISTAFAHCPLPNINESFYSVPLECDEAIALAEKGFDSVFDVNTSNILVDWPNTYTFTKAIAESVIKKYGEGQGLPTGIVRPSIVIWSQSEPVPGWLDNFYGAGGVAAAIFSGMGHTMHIDPKMTANIIPADVVVNGLIAAAWDVGKNWFPRSTTPIYQSVSSTKSPITWETFSKEIVVQSRDKPSTKAVTLPFTLISRHISVVHLYIFFLHWLPGLVMDALMMCAGQTTRLMPAYKRIHNFTTTLSYFCLREWNYEEKNLVHLWSILDEQDQKLFPFDMTSMDWEKFFRDTFVGFRTYLMKESPESIPAAKKRLRRLVWFQFTLLCLVVCSFGIILYRLY